MPVSFHLVKSACSAHASPHFTIGRFSFWSIEAQLAANVAIGTAAGVASGADFDDSFYASAFTAAASAGAARLNVPPAVGVTIAAAVGGTVSELSGGKFANGAVTGAFEYAVAAAAESLSDTQWPTYATQDEAAEAALNDINPLSVAEDREYGGMIYRSPDGTYSVTDPNRRGELGLVEVDPGGPESVPPGTTATAYCHTHGASNPNYVSERFSGILTDGSDIGYANRYHIDGYLATPKGLLMRYDHETCLITTIGRVRHQKCVISTLSIWS